MILPGSSTEFSTSGTTARYEKFRTNMMGSNTTVFTSTCGVGSIIFTNISAEPGMTTRRTGMRGRYVLERRSSPSFASSVRDNRFFYLHPSDPFEFGTGFCHGCPVKPSKARATSSSVSRPSGPLRDQAALGPLLGFGPRGLDFLVLIHHSDPRKLRLLC